jgi:putative toxin-antitoxin system antitoxin component (TIGR02293 family)
MALTTIKKPRARKEAPLVRGAAKKPATVALQKVSVPKIVRNVRVTGLPKVRAYNVNLPDAFGGVIIGSPIEVIKRTREGLPATVFGEIATYLNIPQTQLYDAVGVSRSTMAGRIKGDQPLSVSEGDKVLRLVKVLARAAEVLGDKESAKKWLQREIRSIGGVQPITMLDTEAGYELVMDTLGRIEHGIAA